MNHNLEQAFYQRTYLLDPQVPRNISIQQVKQAYQPYSLKIDVDSWLKIYAHRKPTYIEHFYAKRVKNGDCYIGFNALLCKATCPRRYVGFVDKPLGLSWVYSERDSRSVFKCPDTVFLQSIPKVYRSTLRVPNGLKLVDLDLIACHISILAWVSQDPALQLDVLHDCHALVGNLFFPKLSAKNQRKIGKVINTILPMGCTKYGLCEELNILFRRLNLKIDFDLMDAENVIHRFWGRYPQANKYRLWTYKHIGQIRDNGGDFKISWDDRLLFRFGNYVLQGQHLAENRVSMLENRQFGSGKNRTILGAASAIYRAIERVLMDTVMVCLLQSQEQYGLIRCFCPMYDGALLVVEENCDLLAMSARINEELALFNGFRVNIEAVG